MLEILQFYVSGFWIWLGITLGLGIIVSGIVRALAIIVMGIAAMFNKQPVTVNFKD